MHRDRGHERTATQFNDRGSAAREHASKLREVLNRAERFVPDVVSAREPAA